MQETNRQSRRPLPLDGVRIADFTHMVSGPLATQILGDMGASVDKVEAIDGGDIARKFAPYVNGMGHYFLSINRNKRSITVDLKSQEGQEIALALALKSDVVIENFAPGTMGRFGLGYDRLSKLKPDLIFCSISGFGQVGPLARKKSFDLVAQAYSGIMSTNGEPDSPPVKVGIPIADTGTGLVAAIAVLGAILKRNSSGLGSYIDLSMYDSVLSLLANHAGYYLASGRQAPKTGSHHYAVVPNGSFRTRDGHVVIAVTSDELWREFCEALSLDDLKDDPRFSTIDNRTANIHECREMVARRVETQTTAEILAQLEARNIPCGPVHTIGEALEHPAIAMRDMVYELEHAVYGRARAVGSPLGPSLVREKPEAPPLLGEHNAQILFDLGYDAKQIEALIRKGVVGSRTHAPA